MSPRSIKPTKRPNTSSNTVHPIKLIFKTAFSIEPTSAQRGAGDRITAKAAELIIQPIPAANQVNHNIHAIFAQCRLLAPLTSA